MKIRGNKRLFLNVYIGLVSSLIATMLIIDDKKLGLVSSVIAIVLFSIFYCGFAWIKEIEISDNILILRRVLWSSKIKISNIKEIKFTKTKIIISRKNDSPLKYFISQINPMDLEKFYEHTKHYC